MVGISRAAGCRSDSSGSATSGIGRTSRHLERERGQEAGGGFSINEYSQVIARTAPAGGYQNQQAVHIVGIRNGEVVTYTNLITFQGGMLDPSATPTVGDPW